MTMRLFTCLLTLGLGVVLSSGCKPKAPPAPPSTEISLATEPAGASVTVDGREAGVTPLKLKVDHGGHFIVMEMAGT